MVLVIVSDKIETDMKIYKGCKMFIESIHFEKIVIVFEQLIIRYINP